MSNNEPIPLLDLGPQYQALRDDIVLVIDEAYGEFADHLDELTFDLVDHGNTAVLRTFSKAYGLAAMRIGWGLFPQWIAVEIQKVMNPNTLTSVSEAAAIAAISDHAYMRETVDITAQIRDHFRVRLIQSGITVLPSFTNFLLLEFDTVDQALRLDTALRAEGIFLRPQSGAGLPQCLRLTVGPEDHMTAALNILEREVRS